jgi:hypothetical protein
VFIRRVIYKREKDRIMNKHYFYFQIFSILLFTFCTEDISGPINGPVYDERNISRNEGFLSYPRVSVDNSGDIQDHRNFL